MVGWLLLFVVPFGLVAATSAAPAAAPTDRVAWRFDFGSGPVAEGAIGVGPEQVYDPVRGWGFEPGAALRAVTLPGGDAFAGDAITGDAAFFFTVDLPEGNYRVAVTLGARADAPRARTTVKAELRRLMLENVAIPAGGTVTRTFWVNVRTPQIAAANDVAAGVVRLKAPRETTEEAWAWDRRLTLEFNGAAPTVCGIEIAPADVPTVYLLGDSTVCDQAKEPYASWGQMLPRFLAQGVAVANHGESGETYRDALARRRVDKILSGLRRGDLVLFQFGHNDQKQIKAGTGGPFTTYVEEMRRCMAAVRARGGVPVLVTSMERRAFTPEGQVVESLRDYAAAVRQVAAAEQVACLDLQAQSRVLYATLGEAGSRAAFATQDGKIDNTHHNPYGAYLLAQAIAEGLRAQRVVPATWMAPDWAGFDPRHPLPGANFEVPASPRVTHLRPLGD